MSALGPEPNCAPAFNRSAGEAAKRRYSPAAFAGKLVTRRESLKQCFAHGSPFGPEREVLDDAAGIRWRESAGSDRPTGQTELLTARGTVAQWQLGPCDLWGISLSIDVICANSGWGSDEPGCRAHFPFGGAVNRPLLRGCCSDR
jgi:hypothetical protein